MTCGSLEQAKTIIYTPRFTTVKSYFRISQPLRQVNRILKLAERASQTEAEAGLRKMSLRKKEDYIPIKCEGWNGKFVYPDGAVNNVSKIRRQNQNVTNTNNFYGFNTEPIVLPTAWDGTFVKGGETRIKPERNRSDDQDYFDYNTDPTILSPVWNGEFVTDPNDVRIKPERNFSDARDYAEASRFKLVQH